MHVVVAVLFFQQSRPLAREAVQRLFQCLGRELAQHFQIDLLQLGRVHAARARDHIVRLVDQHIDLPVVRQGHAVQHGAEVEIIVVVADHDIAPARQFHAQVIRADALLQGDGAHGFLVEYQTAGQRHLARQRQTVVKTLGQRTRFAVAGLVRMLAGAALSAQFQHAQGQQRGAILQDGAGVERHLAARNLGGQEKQFIQAMRGRRFQHREQAAHRLADTGRRLRQQAAATAAGLVHGLGQLALSWAKVRMGEGHAGELRVAAGAVRHFLFGPVEEQRAMLLEEGTQRPGRAFLVHERFLLARDIEIHERHAQHGQVQLLAQQVAIDARLRPVQLAVVGGHGVQVAPVCLDFFQLAPRRVVAIGAAPHVQGSEVAGQADFALVIIVAPARDGGVARHAFLRRGRRREAQVQVARLGREFAQGAHGDRVGVAAHAAACHCR
ncbi:hypothetical protein D3C81_707900 [compost metagenome]